MDTTIETTDIVATDAVSTEIENPTDNTVAKTLTISAATMAALVVGYVAYGKAKAFTTRKLVERRLRHEVGVVIDGSVDTEPTPETLKV